MVFAPFLGSAAIPTRLKAALTVALTVVLYPACSVRPTTLEVFDWLPIILGEAIVGLLMGLTLHFVFDGVQLAGQVLGFQLGYSLVNLIDPQTQVDTPVLSIFHRAVALLIFLSLDVHHWLLRGLAKSFSYLPPGTIVVSNAAAEQLCRAAGAMLVVAVQIAAPALTATILADLVLGFLGKASPQLPVLFVGLSVKALVAFAVLQAAVRFWPRVLEKHFLAALAISERLLRLTG